MKNFDANIKKINTNDFEVNKNEVQTSNNQSNEVEDTTNNIDYYLTKSVKLSRLEKMFKQPIRITNLERENPYTVKPFLNKIAKDFGLKLDEAKTANLFEPPEADDTSFEDELLIAYGDDSTNATYEKACTRFYVYAVLLMRKSMAFNKKHFDGLSKNYNFNINDIYHSNLAPQCFTDLADVPTGIVNRCKKPQDDYRIIVEDFLRVFIPKTNQYEHINNDILTTSEILQAYEGKELDKDANKQKEQLKRKINDAKNKLPELAKALEKISFDIEKELHKDAHVSKNSVTTEDVADFIADFVNYAVPVPYKKYSQSTKIQHENGITYTTDKALVQSATLKELYFYHSYYKTWMPFKDIAERHLLRISVMQSLTKSAMTELSDNLLTNISKKEKTNIITFKPNLIFMKDGVIVLNMDGKTLKTNEPYTFIANQELDKRELMYKYATTFRLRTYYQDDDASKTFIDDTTGEDIIITPQKIFDDLGRRGYETRQNMTQSEIDEVNHEAKSRSNLLKQYLLNALILYNDLEIVGKKFLYLYKAGGSGKSTFMELIQNFFGEEGAVSLKAKDLSVEKSQFGLANIQGKFLVICDEATDGTTAIDVETIKQFVTKEQNISVNKKNQEYVTFTPQASFIFASNNKPRFNDESEGTQRRLLGFKLETGYTNIGNSSSGQKDLLYLKNVLVKDNAFLVACLIYALKTVDLSAPVPKSVLDDSEDIIVKEDDIQEFINDRLRPKINKPFIVSKKDLFSLYQIEMFSQGRNRQTARGSISFERGIEKLKQGVWTYKGSKHSKPRIQQISRLNDLLYIEGMLFSDLHRNSSDLSSFSTTLTKHFFSKIEERENELKKFYEKVYEYNEYQNGNSTKKVHLSNIGTKRHDCYVILPDDEEYNDYDSSDVNNLVKETVTSQRNEFLTKHINKDNLLIFSEMHANQVNGSDDTFNTLNAKLPTQVQSNLSSSFNHYSIKEEDGTGRKAFKSFI